MNDFKIGSVRVFSLEKDMILRASFCKLTISLNLEVDTIGERSSSNAKKIDYKALHNHRNTPFMTMEKNVVSEHIGSFDHSKGDIEYKILDFESDWQKTW